MFVVSPPGRKKRVQDGTADLLPGSFTFFHALFVFLAEIATCCTARTHCNFHKKGRRLFLAAIALLLRNIFEFTLELHSSRSDQGIRPFLLPGGGRGRESSEDCGLGTIGYPASFLLSPPPKVKRGARYGSNHIWGAKRTAHLNYTHAHACIEQVRAEGNRETVVARGVRTASQPGWHGERNFLAE